MHPSPPPQQPRSQGLSSYRPIERARRKFKVALNPMYRIVINFAKSYMLSCLSKFYNNFTVPFLKYKRFKLKLRVFLAGHSVVMVTYSLTKITPTYSPVTGQFFDTMIVALIKSDNYDPSKSTS